MKHAFPLLMIFASAVTAEELLIPPAASRFKDRGTTSIPDFQKHVVPLLGRLGCNSAKCHGSFQGQGGFRLSLFGFDFAADHRALTSVANSEDGSRLSVNVPDTSLIVLKATEQIDHEGGQRFARNSWEHHLLLRWIESGAKGVQFTTGQATPAPASSQAEGENSTSEPQASGKVLAQLLYEPEEILFQKSGDTSQITVIAEWESGEREDITCLARFRTNNDSVVTVNEDGLATAAEPGDTHIVAFYDNGVAAVPVLQPYSKPPIASSKREQVGRVVPEANDERNPIDRFVATKLSKLGLEPSESCSDAEFLRRVSIDLAGTLPAPHEVEAFVADDAADKRPRKINELLDRPTYAAWWANKLCDFTGCSPTAFGQQTSLEVGHGYSTQWYDWIFRRVTNNTPYDELVEGIVLAKSRGAGETLDEYAAEMSSYVRRASPADFSLRETMPHYWIRDTVKEDKDKALAFAHSFLGIQLQCAQCHKHPFDKWTQDDFNDFTGFFEGVKSRGRIGFPQFAAAQRGEIVDWPELFVVRSAKDTSTITRLLRSTDVDLAKHPDPRQPIMDWMRERDNPWFARAFVNRVWAGYFHVGIVEPPDQFTPANPPSNPQLLDWLTNGFVENGYDMKWLHRQIASSETYQRSWKPNDTNRHDRRNFSRAIPRRIPAEVIYDAMKQATAATDELDEVRTNLKRRASGHLSMRMAGTHAMKVFGKPERAINCDCERVNEPTLLQAVFVHNDPLVRMRLADSGWIAEIDAAGTVDEQELINQVWLRTVNRRPTVAEVARAIRHLGSVDTITEGLTDLLWAMFNTKEFLLNH